MANSPRGIYVSQGRYPYKVRIDWSTATDQNDIIDQFRVYRRIYTLPTPTMLGNKFSHQRISPGTSTKMWLLAPSTNTRLEPSLTAEQILKTTFKSKSSSLHHLTTLGSEPTLAWRQERSCSKTDHRPTVSTSWWSPRDNECPKCHCLPGRHIEKMTIPPSSERSSVWPDINSREAAAEWSVSGGSRFQAPPLTNNAGPEFTGVPILGFNAADAETQDVSEVFGIYAIAKSDTTYQLTVRQAGTDYLFDGMVADLDAYNHLIITLTNEGGEKNAIRVHARMHPDASQIQPQMRASLALNGIASDFNEARGRVALHHVECSGVWPSQVQSPQRQQLRANVRVRLLSACDYNTPLDVRTPLPQNYGSSASWDYPTGNSDACDCNPGRRKLLFIRWFSDASETATAPCHH